MARPYKSIIAYLPHSFLDLIFLLTVVWWVVRCQLKANAGKFSILRKKRFSQFSPSLVSVWRPLWRIGFQYILFSVESRLFCNTQVQCSLVPSGGMCRLGCARTKRFEGINCARRDSGGLPGSSVTASYVSLWKSHLCEACKLLPVASHPEQKLTRQREEGVLFLQTQGPWLDVPFRFHLTAESGIPHPNLVFSQMADSAVSVSGLWRVCSSQIRLEHAVLPLGHWDCDLCILFHLCASFSSSGKLR